MAISTAYSCAMPCDASPPHNVHCGLGVGLRAQHPPACREGQGCRVTSLKSHAPQTPGPAPTHPPPPISSPRAPTPVPSPFPLLTPALRHTPAGHGVARLAFTSPLSRPALKDASGTETGLPVKPEPRGTEAREGLIAKALMRNPEMNPNRSQTLTERSYNNSGERGMLASGAAPIRFTARLRGVLTLY